jgi:hypothetical protein
VKTSAADGKIIMEENKTPAIAAIAPDETSDASKTTGAAEKLEDKEKPPLA